MTTTPNAPGGQLSRRSFLQVMGTAAGGLTVGILLDGCSHVKGAQALGGGGFNPNAWLHIAPDDTITFFLDRAEMGQGVWTSHVQLLCEELEVAPSSIRVSPAPADWVRYGTMVTGGSTSTTAQFDVLRSAGASARELLRKAAAQRWGVPVDEVTAKDGAMVHARHGSLRYGALSDTAAGCFLEGAPPLKDPKDWRVIGKPLRRLDAVAKVTGKAEYGLDVRVPGMRFAIVLRPPTIGGSVKRFDATRAKAAAGVVDVFAIPQGIAVVATSTWHARQAAALVDATWDAGALAGVSTASVVDQQRAMLKKPGKVVERRGDADRALEAAAKRTRAVYQAPFVAHATMEPMNATAHVEANRCRVWAGTQAPTVAKAIAANISGVPRDNIDIITTHMGGGFGRRGLPDFVAEAVFISKQLGAPVQVGWSREDDMRNDQYRPAALSLVEGGVDKDGWPCAWMHRLCAQSLMASYTSMSGKLHLELMPKSIGELVGDLGRLYVDGHLIEPTAVEGAADNPYLLADGARVEVALFDSPLPVSAWRSVGHSINGFIVDSFVDELAHLGGKDPLQVRRRLLQHAPRSLGVLEAAARGIGWERPRRPGRFLGLAQHVCFDSYCAQGLELSVDDGRLRVHRVVSAIDCGRVVNPDLVAAQMESGVVYGLSAALYQRIDLEDGRVVQGNFHQHPLLRMLDMPRVETIIVPSTERPTGVGELSVPPVAAALGNAFFAATGTRLRRLPMMPDIERVLRGDKPEPEVVL